MNEQFLYLLARLHFNAATRRRVWKKLAMQVKHGLSFDRGLHILQDQFAERASFLPNVYAIIRSRIANGHPLGLALLGFAGYEEIMLIAAGQASGKLVDSLRLVVELLEARRKIVAAAVSALTFPILMALAYMATLWVVARYVMPMLAMLSNPAKWTGMAAMLYTASSFVNSVWGILALVAGIALMGVFFWSLPNWTGPLRVRFDRFPPWSMYRLTVGAVWLYTVSIFMRSKTPLARILNDMLSSESTTPYLRERVQAILENSQEGETFGQALHMSEMHFPDPAIVDDLRVFSELPGFEDQLSEMSQDWLTDGVERIQAQGKILNAVCIVLLLVFIIGFAFAAISLQSQLKPRGM